MRLLIILTLFFPLIVFAQKSNFVKTDSSVIETKHFKYLNSIREFNELKSGNRIYYKEYNFTTKQLREFGVFEKGYSVGVWKYYSEDGQLLKTIDYDTNIKKLYGKISEPFDSVFNFIKHQADSLLKAKYGSVFFSGSMIQNTNRSYYYGSGTPGTWFEPSNYRPKEYLMRYDIRLSNGTRLFFIEFNLDSLGKLLKSLKNISNFKQKSLISIEKVNEITFQKGLSLNDQPLEYSLFYEHEKLFLKINGKQFSVIKKEHEIIQKFTYVLLDPWTGKFIRKGIDEVILNVD